MAKNIFLDGSGIVFVVGGGGCIGWVCGGSSICYITPEWACSGHTGRLWPHVASLGRRSSGPRSAHWRQGTSLRSGPPSPPHLLYWLATFQEIQLIWSGIINLIGYWFFKGVAMEVNRENRLFSMKRISGHQLSFQMEKFFLEQAE